MDNLVIEATKYTPKIDFNGERGVLEIRGKSYPENSFEFYKPIMEWIEKYFQNPKKRTIINIELVYFNSSSSKFLFDLFDKLEEEKNRGHEILINWIFDEDNDVAEEAGMDFQEDFGNLNINLITKD